ncbi:MAG: hypothetical protein ACFFB3_07130, partial [Candidatus Hodarchaeota archaeon]
TAKSPSVLKETPTEENRLGGILQGLYGFCNAPDQSRDLFAIDTLCGVKIVFLEEEPSEEVSDEVERMKGWVHIHPGSRLNRAALTIETKEGYDVNILADKTIELIRNITEGHS